MAREMTAQAITMREFTNTDWYGYAGCEAFPNGQPPLIAYVETPGDGGLCLVVDATGAYVELTDADGACLWTANLPLDLQPRALGQHIVAHLDLRTALETNTLTSYLESLGFTVEAK